MNLNILTPVLHLTTMLVTTVLHRTVSSSSLDKLISINYQNHSIGRKLVISRKLGNLPGIEHFVDETEIDFSAI